MTRELTAAVPRYAFRLPRGVIRLAIAWALTALVFVGWPVWRESKRFEYVPLETRLEQAWIEMGEVGQISTCQFWLENPESVWEEAKADLNLDYSANRVPFNEWMTARCG